MYSWASSITVGLSCQAFARHANARAESSSQRASTARLRHAQAEGWMAIDASQAARAPALSKCSRRMTPRWSSAYQSVARDALCSSNVRHAGWTIQAPGVAVGSWVGSWPVRNRVCQVRCSGPRDVPGKTNAADTAGSRVPARRSSSSAPQPDPCWRIVLAGRSARAVYCASSACNCAVLSLPLSRRSTPCQACCQSG